MKHISTRTQHRTRQARRKAKARTASKQRRRDRRAVALVRLANEVRDAILREQERAMNYAGVAPYEVGP